MPTDITVPAAVRAGLAPLGFDPVDIARSVPMDQGEIRRRSRFRTVPQVAQTQWRLSQAAFDAFWLWFESDLRAGEREFDIELERQGGTSAGPNPRTQWWTVKFVEPPSYEVASGFLYTISARLITRGTPFDARVTPGVTSSSIDRDSGGWEVAPTSIRASSTDADGGGWLYLNLPIEATGIDGDSGSCRFPNGTIAAGIDNDSGGLVQLNTPTRAGGIDADAGGLAR